MSFNKILLELPGLTIEQRQLLIRRALEIDDIPLSAAEESIIESRLQTLNDKPSSAVSLEDMKNSIRTRYGK